MLTDLTPNVQRQVERGIAILKNGGVIAYPTDTIYGLGAGAYIETAVKRIYKIKQRPSAMALPLLLADVSEINDVARQVPEVAWLLARQFLPGGLTLVLLKSSSVPDFATAGTDTVAVRVPAHPVPVALVRGIGMPLIGTSANLSGKPNPLSAGDVCRQLGSKIDLVIDGGPSPGGKESTIVDVTREKPVFLREGAIPREKIVEVVGKTLS